MPYIKREDREVIDSTVDSLSMAIRAVGTQPGNLNYAVTKLCLGYMSVKPSYFEFNEVVGVLECTKLELYRRAVAPYERQKCQVNGDVYPEPES